MAHSGPECECFNAVICLALKTVDAILSLQIEKGSVGELVSVKNKHAAHSFQDYEWHKCPQAKLLTVNRIAHDHAK